MRFVPNVPERLIPLVRFAPAIKSPLVAVIWLPVAVSLLATEMRESTVLSVGEPAFAAMFTRSAASVLAAMVADWFHWMSTPAEELAVVPWALVMVKRSADQVVEA